VTDDLTARRRPGALAAVLTAVLPALVAAQSGPTVHKLRPSPTTVVLGGYDARVKPALTIKSGDIVEIETAYDVAGLRQWGVKEEWIRPESREMHLDQVKERGPGPHMLVGPVYVVGAEPGDVLEVRIQAIDLLDPFAVNVFWPDHGTLAADFPFEYVKLVPLDLEMKIARFAPGIDVPLHPFFGSMGVAPPRSVGRVNSRPPGVFGGNMDNKDLVAGTTLYLPVLVPGALFQAGDTHAAQGHGEMDGTALETSLRGTFQLVVRKDLHWRWPHAETPTAFITMGFSQDLDEAAMMASREMVAFLAERYKLRPEDAYVLASGAVDLHVTQNVDGVKGVHASVSKSLFSR
jgi:acetamidase/formamidase